MSTPSTPEIYELHLQGIGEKTGRLESVGDEVPALDFASPPSFGGPGGVWTPEHLFVAAAASCLMTTFRTVAQISRVEVLSYEDNPSGRLVRDPDKRFRIDLIVLRPRVEVADPALVDKVERLLHKAEEVCLISRSIDSEVILEPEVHLREQGTAAR